jgi:hypothetical protein
LFNDYPTQLLVLLATQPQLLYLLGNISWLNSKDNPMITINVAANDPNKEVPTQPAQQNQQPSDNENQRGGTPSKDKPAQQK